MIDGEDSGGHEPGDPQDRVDHDAHSHDQQVQVVPAPFLQSIINQPINQEEIEVVPAPFLQSIINQYTTNQ